MKQNTGIAQGFLTHSKAGIYIYNKRTKFSKKVSKLRLSETCPKIMNLKEMSASQSKVILKDYGLWQHERDLDHFL